MRLRWFAIPMSVVAALAPACHRTLPASAESPLPVQTETRLEAQKVLLESNDISPGRLASVAAHLASLRLEPATLALRVGDTVVIRDRVQVLAIDSAGASLGRLPVYDSRLWPGAAALAGIDRVAARHPGVSRMEISFPCTLWRGRTDPCPMVDLQIEVRD